MNDPLRIFTDDQLKNLNAFHLQRLKKEFFIPFKFGGAKKVVLNNYEIDAETLEAIFVELESNLDDYLSHSQNEVVNDFLFSGNLEFLTVEKKFNEVALLINSNPKLESKVAQKLSHIISDICGQISKNSFYRLELIKDFTSQFNNANRELVYGKCFEEIKTKIDTVKNDDFNPFVDEFSTNYTTVTGKYVDIAMAEMFDYLPGQFKILDQQYSFNCKEVIVNKTVNREPDLSKFATVDLQIFLDASKIAARHHNSAALQNNIETITKSVTEKKFRFKGATGIWGVILLIVTIAVFALKLSRVSKSSPLSSSDPGYETVDEKRERFNELMAKKMKEREMNRTNPNGQTSTQFDSNEIQIIEDFIGKKNTEPNVKEVLGNLQSGLSIKELCKNYSGEQVDIYSLKQNVRSETIDTLSTEFTTDLFPSLPDVVAKIFLLNNKNSTPQAAKVTFINRDLNFELSHILHIPDATGYVPDNNIYLKKEPETNAKLSFSAKRIPYKDYNVKGYITLKETQSGNIKKKLAFRIRYDLENKLFHVLYGQEDQYLEISLADALNPSGIQEKENMYVKFSCIIQNLGILHNKYLSQGNWYRIENISEYDLSVDLKSMSKIFNIKKEKGYLRYNFTSISDDMAYCELITDRAALKFVANHKTGIPKGMIRSTVSADKNFVEQIVAIRQ